jgi:hypothetical protein
MTWEKRRSFSMAEPAGMKEPKKLKIESTLKSSERAAHPHIMKPKKKPKY